MNNKTSLCYLVLGITDYEQTDVLKAFGSESEAEALKAELETYRLTKMESPRLDAPQDEWQRYEAGSLNWHQKHPGGPGAVSVDRFGVIAVPFIPAAIQLEASGIERAAQWVESRRDAYVSEFGNHDPETGAVELPGTGEEYVGELEEIAEGIRGLIVPAAAGTQSDSNGYLKVPQDIQTSKTIPEWMASECTHTFIDFAVEGGCSKCAELKKARTDNND